MKRSKLNIDLLQLYDAKTERINMNRRYFFLAAASLSAGCASGRLADSSAPGAAARAPAIGQTWRYAKRDGITREFLDAETYRVASIGDCIELTAESTAQKGAMRSHWNPLSLVSAAHRDQPGRQLPSEVQKTWGMILVDSHWSNPQTFQEPIPLWPERLRTGWSTRIHTRYFSADSSELLPWELTMRAKQWESLSVPAGQFNVLRFTNLIKFSSGDRFRRTSERRETLWFAPEIGRWVARESSGTYYREDSIDDQPLQEASYRWELLGWS